MCIFQVSVTFMCIFQVSVRFMCIFQVSVPFMCIFQVQFNILGLHCTHSNFKTISERLDLFKLYKSVYISSVPQTRSVKISVLSI